MGTVHRIHALETLTMVELAKGEWEQKGEKRAVLRDWLFLGACKRKGRKSRSAPGSEIRMAECPGTKQVKIFQKEDMVSHRDGGNNYPQMTCR